MLKNALAQLLQISPNPKQRVVQFLVFCIFIIAAVIRIYIYGDPNLSIAGNDTLSYVESSHVPLFSSEMMTGRRLLTTNLLYKIFEPRDGYQILANGSITTIRRAIQPGFNNIVIAQLIISIAGWCLLSLSVSENIQNPFLKILSVVVITSFAFTPQMADWDSILLSESFTFSLFALQLAILIKLVFLIYKDPDSKISTHIVFWAVVYFLWTFLRDTNLFASFVMAGMVGVLLFSIRYRKNKYLHSVLVFVVVIIIIGLATSGNSKRSLVQLTNVYRDDLLHSDSRVSTLKKLGMPAPDSADYQVWFQKNSAKTLIKFMFIHPGYPVFKIMKDFPQAFTEIKQTYFRIPEHAQARELLMALGNTLHLENTTPFLLDLILLFGLILLAQKNTYGTSRPWTWLGVWLFLTASITLIPTILGDTWALNRHALFSTMIYRLFMWVFTIIIIDIAIEQNVQNKPASKQEA
jgi:hypothetical protein